MLLSGSFKFKFITSFFFLENKKFCVISVEFKKSKMMILLVILIEIGECCRDVRTVQLHIGRNEVEYEDSDFPKLTFEPEIEGDYEFTRRENKLVVIINSLREQETHICRTFLKRGMKGEEEDKPGNDLRISFLSWEYLLKTALPSIALLWVIIIIILLIIVLLMIISFIKMFVKLFTDKFCDHGKYIEQYFDENFGVKQDDLSLLLSRKGLYTQETLTQY